MQCADCQAAVGRLVAPARIERIWADVEDALDAPRRGAVEIVLLRLGVRDHLARLLASTPSLSVSWLGAVALTLGFAVIAAGQGERGMLLFLCVAALLPLASVAAALRTRAGPDVRGRARGTVLEHAAAAASHGGGASGDARAGRPRRARRARRRMDRGGVARCRRSASPRRASRWRRGSLRLVRSRPWRRPGWRSSSRAPLQTGDRLAAFGDGPQVAFAAVAVAAAAVLALRRDHLDIGRTL